MNGRRQTNDERRLEREHRASIARKMAQPKGLGQLLLWFLEGFRTEMPEAVHVAGVWRDYVRLDENRQAEGGSLLGSPRLADPFRAFIEGSPFATELSEYEGHQSREGDEHYRMPMRAAIAHLNGRHLCNALERNTAAHICPENATFARLAYRIASRDGDWESAGLEFVQPSLVRFIVEAALVRLWQAYREAPPARLEEVAVVA